MESLKFPSSRYSRKLVWSGFAVALAVLIVFSVMLPLYFAYVKNGDTPGGDEIPDEMHFYSDDSLEFIPIESVEAFNERYGCEVKSVSGSVIISTFNIISIKDGGSVIGLEISLYGLSDTVGNAEIDCYLGKDRMLDQNFPDLLSKALFYDLPFQYNMDIINEDYIYHIAFSEGGLYYTISASCSSELDLTFLLDEIFNDQSGDNNDKLPGEDSIHYSSSDDLHFEIIDSIESFNEQNNCVVKKVNTNCMLPTSFKVISEAESGEVYGLSIEMKVFIEPVALARLLCFNGSGRIQDANFVNLLSEAEYEGVHVNYNVDINTDLGYMYYIAFTVEGIYYNIEATCIYEEDVIAILNLIFDQ